MLALVAIGFLAFNFPLLGLLGAGGSWYGIPAPFVYLYVGWAIFIALVALCLGGGRRRAGRQGLAVESRSGVVRLVVI